MGPTAYWAVEHVLEKHNDSGNCLPRNVYINDNVERPNGFCRRYGDRRRQDNYGDTSPMIYYKCIIVIH